MKKLIFIFLILLVSVSLYSAPRHDNFYIREADSTNTYFQLVAAESDTSEWYPSNPVMSFHIFARDTSSNGSGVKDSVSAIIYYQAAPAKYVPVTASDSYTFTSTLDSVGVVWNKTATVTSSASFFRLIITSDGDNDIKAGSLFDIFYDGYPAK